MKSNFDIIKTVFSLKGKGLIKITFYLTITTLFISFIYIILFAGEYQRILNNPTDTFLFEQFFYKILLFGPLLNALLIAPLFWGIEIMSLRNIREEKGAFNISHIFDGFRDWKRVTFTLLLRSILIFLWSLLFIIPGVIKSLSYAMTSYILHDCPNFSYGSAISLSDKMMHGYKMKLFGLVCIIILFAFGIIYVTTVFAEIILTIIFYAVATTPIALFSSIIITVILRTAVSCLAYALSYYSFANFYEELKKEHASWLNSEVNISEIS